MLDQIYSVPCVSGGSLLLVPSSTETSSESELTHVFMKDLVDTFFISLNKFTAAMAIRECTLWLYQLEHGLNDRWVILPGEEKYRERSKKQINREGMLEGYLNLVWGDYSVAFRFPFDS